MTNRFNTVMARRLTSYSIYQLSWMTNQRSMVWFLQIHYSLNRLGQDTFQIKFLEWEADLISLTIIISIMTTIPMVTIIISQIYFHVGTTLNLELILKLIQRVWMSIKLINKHSKHFIRPIYWNLYHQWIKEHGLIWLEPNLVNQISKCHHSY